jgi:chemotaxis protein histidine kinase CheA
MSSEMSDFFNKAINSTLTSSLNTLTNTTGGDPDEDDNDYDNAEQEVFNDDFFAGGNGDNDDMLYKLGGSKQENERTFCVEEVNIGSYKGGRFVSTSAYNAAKKAATAIFRHIDIETGLVKPKKSSSFLKHHNLPNNVGMGNNRLKKLFGNKRVNTVVFILCRHDKKNPVKYYKYEAVRSTNPDGPVTVKRTINKGTSREKTITITFNQIVSIHPVPLDDEYVAMNKEAQKEYAATKRAAKVKAENPEKKVKATKKTAEKKVKASKTATIDDIIRSLSASPKKKAEKKPKAAAAKKPKAAAEKKPKAAAEKKPKAAAEKKPKAAAEKKPKAAAKKVKGGGYCSFF